MLQFAETEFGRFTAGEDEILKDLRDGGDCGRLRCLHELSQQLPQNKLFLTSLGVSGVNEYSSSDDAGSSSHADSLALLTICIRSSHECIAYSKRSTRSTYSDSLLAVTLKDEFS